MPSHPFVDCRRQLIGRQAEPGESGRNGQLTCQKEYFIAFALYAFPDARDYASIQGHDKIRAATAHHPNTTRCKIDTIFKNLTRAKNCLSH
ncbi:MAG: hypothetical protein NTW45_03550 [Rhodocyclales bacterium]|nr:hypothetical protein [Rhodocyclales bacterium]